MKFKNILVSTDLSEASIEAFDLAAYEAKMHGAKIHLVHVIERSAYPYDTQIAYLDLIVEYKQQEEDAARKSLAELAEKYFHDCIVGINVLIQENSVGKDLAKYAKENACEGIMISSAGRGYLGKIILGSTVLRVLESAEVPVIVIPKAKKED